MLLALFSFEGRIGRLQYLGWSIASTIIMAIFGSGVAFILLFSLAGSMRGMTPDQIVHWPAFWVTAGLFLAFVAWPGFALAAKRLRDIGLSPFWIFAYVGFLVADHILIAPFLHASMTRGTVVGAIFSCLYGLFLLLMPGRDNDERPDLSYLAPEIERMRRQAYAENEAPAPRMVPAPARAPDPGANRPKEFGRRR